jgi:hypothetical protein
MARSGALRAMIGLGGVLLLSVLECREQRGSEISGVR